MACWNQTPTAIYFLRAGDLLPPKHVIQIPVESGPSLVQRLLLEAIEVHRGQLEFTSRDNSIEVLLRPVPQHVRFLDHAPLLSASRLDAALLIRPPRRRVLAHDAPG